jgi:hypothetical protein
MPAADSPSSVGAGSPKASAPSSPLSPLEFVSHGRPKQDRLKDNSPSPASPVSPIPVKVLVGSYRDVLMAPPPSVASAAVGTAAAASVVLHAPCSLETATSEGPSPATMVPLSTSSGADGTAVTASAVRPAPRSLTKSRINEGWQKVESRRSRRKWLKPVRSRRPVPADLAGRCFNCFSTTHFAAQCQQ